MNTSTVKTVTVFRCPNCGNTVANLPEWCNCPHCKKIMQYQGVVEISTAPTKGTGEK
jgi:rubrerythrin